ncbi:MAG: DUF996 domain-containing protein [Candidatus Bathyarchaeia archaeon]|jgi:uncharacterized membrane protein
MSNSTFESSKILSAIGALLTFLGFIPILGIIGLILLVIGLKGLSEHYRDPSIYQNAFRGSIFGFIGFVILSIGTGSIFTTGAISLGFVGVIASIIGVIVLLIIAFIFFLLMAINFRKVLFSLGERSGEHLFFTAGKLLYLGAILTIIVFGYILIFIAWILATIAFLTMRQGASTPSYSYTPPPTTQPPPTAPTANTGTQYCPHCGAPVSQGATFCSHCGKQI